MRRRSAWIGLLAAWVAMGGVCRAQQVVDRIVARVEGDILTLSQLRELRGFQQLAGETPAGDKELLEQLIRQWIVNHEAAAARYPKPATQRVDAAVESLKKQFASPAAYRARLRVAGISAATVRRMVQQEIYLSSYLDYKFRPAAQIGREEIERYYREELGPQLAAKGQPAPPLDTIRERIRELLIQRDISARADLWLSEARSRLKIEIEPQAGGSSGRPGE